MNEHVEFAKGALSSITGKEVRGDTAQSVATIALASAVIGLAEILEQGLTRQR